MIKLKPSVIDIVSKKYQILEIVDLYQYDSKLDELHDLFLKYQNYVFNFNERIIILHHDTDYYVSLDTAGFTTYNLIAILSKFNIPTEFLIFFTNHYGIKSELNQLSQQAGNSSPLNVIYTSLWHDFPNVEQLPAVSQNSSISYTYCCVNGVQRNHRVAMLCNLKAAGILEQGLISYHFSREDA